MNPQPKPEKIRIDHKKPTYKKLQQSVVERDRESCRVCDKHTVYLNGVHHVKPLARGGSDTKENMVLLCLDCHDGFHRGAKYKGKMIDGKFEYWEI
ncbi:MAG TPA: HNH endonuclease [bacterium]|nr:HNH endonuclease [bacterium]